MKHFISTEQLSRELLERLFCLADQIRNHPWKYSEILRHKVVATLFFEPSTRTRLSFESALQRLGAKLISSENAKEMSSFAKGENIRDTIRVIQGYCDAIILRHYDNNAAREAAKVARIPIINGGCGSGEHPTQTLLDLYTIYRNKKRMDGLKIAILGDLKFGRTVHSLVNALSLFQGIEIYGYGIKNLDLQTEYVSSIQSKGIKYHPVSSFEEIPESIDVLYQTRIQKERITESTNFSYIIIDRKIMSCFSIDTLLMHPLPRNDEISEEVDEDPRAVYFEQTENGLYARMALLTEIFTENEGW